jgi:prepilin peptidase CpaA
LAIDGIVLRLLSGQLLFGMAAGVGVFAVAALLWRRGLMGGGDVKLLGAASIVVPPGLAAPFVLAVTLAGGLLAMTYLALRCVMPRVVLPRGRPRAARLVRLALVEQRRIRQCRSLPYACAIAAGAVFMLIQG